MFPVQYPRKRTALVTTFFVWPAYTDLNQPGTKKRRLGLEYQHTRRIRNLHAEHQHKRRIVRPRQVVAQQAANLAVKRHKPQPKGSHQVGDQEDEDEDAAAVLEAVVEKHAGEDGEGDEDAVGDL